MRTITIILVVFCGPTKEWRFGVVVRAESESAVFEKRTCYEKNRNCHYYSSSLACRLF